MRVISIEQIQPGMKLGKTIYGAQGQRLLVTGAELKPHYTTYLRSLGISYLYIQDDQLADVQIDDVISESTRVEARQTVKKMFETTQSQEGKKTLVVRDRAVFDTAWKIVDQLMVSPHVVVNLIDLRSTDEFLFAHAVNTSVLASLTAIRLKCTPDEIKQVALGSLLHDVGYTVMPQGLVGKRAPLTEAEEHLLRQHPLYGEELVKKMPSYSRGIAAIVREHHERMDGLGYPKGRMGDEIHGLAQVVSVAQTYDELTSDLPHKPSYLPHQALQLMAVQGGTAFSIPVLREFLSFVAPYPIGTRVMLSNGEAGVVIHNSPGSTWKPVVRVLFVGNSFVPHLDPYDLDLSMNPNVVIEDVI